MKILLRLLTVTLALTVMTTPLQAGWFDNVTSYFRKPAAVLPPTIKVLVVHDQPGVVLEVKGKYKIYDPHTGNHISTRFVGKRKFIQAVRDGIKWGEEFPSVFQLMIIPDSPATTTLVDGVEYRGPVFVYDIGGTISIINQVYIEDYLSSVLSKKYPVQNAELLSAIAIVARTAAYERISNPKSQYWAVDGTKTGYQGSAVIDNASAIEQAIKATRYMVLSRTGAADGQIAAFSAEWKQDGQGASAADAVVSQITLSEAETMAQRGDHAAQILAKAFPGTKIELIHYAPEQPLQVRKGLN